MQTLVIYDQNGVVFYTTTGTFQTPVGIPYLITEVPEGKRVSSVNVEGEEPVAVFEDLPLPTIQQLVSKLNYQVEITEELEAALYDIALMIDQLLPGGDE